MSGWQWPGTTPFRQPAQTGTLEELLLTRFAPCWLMFYGIIKTLSDRGFGFIQQNGGPDVYFHASILSPDEFARIRPDQPVKFELARRDPDEKPSQRKGPRAAKVELIDRMPGGILPEKSLTPPAHRKAKFRKATWKRPIDLSAKNRKPDLEKG